MVSPFYDQTATESKQTETIIKVSLMSRFDLDQKGCVHLRYGISPSSPYSSGQ
jgi:hypothetical protein